MEIKGSLSLILRDESFSKISLSISDKHNKEFTSLFQTNPNLDKKKFSKNILSLVDTKSFPIDQEIKLVQWKYKKVNEDYLPLRVSCWPSKTSKGMSCIIEFFVKNADVLPIQNINIEVPYP
jgi:hypothetical protein